MTLGMRTYDQGVIKSSFRAAGETVVLQQHSELTERNVGSHIQCHLTAF
jgi:hypothetical protein